jgi:acetoacetyl-CoA synthetase
MGKKAITEETFLWEPQEDDVRCSNLASYMEWLKSDKGLSFEDYNSLWEWSVTEIEDFWQSIWEYLEIETSKSYTKVLSERTMPGANWFIGSELNYAEHVFRNMSSERPALMLLTEISWNELYQKVSSLAVSLRNMGVQKGDRVISYMPNIPETIIALLACASIGAVWSSCSPDFGLRSVIDRFKQIKPKIIFAVDGYQYGGKTFDNREKIVDLQNSLPTLEHTILVPYLKPDGDSAGLNTAFLWEDLMNESGELKFEQVPFAHPLWVLYSSGTTGLPKALVHSHGGILIEIMKFLKLHVDVKPQDRFFWFSTTGWVMWNILQGSLLTGATAVLYDGSPGFPDLNVLWEFAEKANITIFGTSAAYITACMNAQLEPARTQNLSGLRAVGSTGSPLSPEGYKWVYEKVKNDILLGSTSGGTDPCTGFIGSCPLLPVRAGEIQCRCLGVNAQAFDEEGNALIEEVGELVITEPMPSMPLYLWNDLENVRYIESYFTMYPGVWRHGDWVNIHKDGSCVILGRSDSTLNRQGVRLGSSEIYAVVESMDEILDSLVVGLETSDSGYYMPLFVVPREGLTLDDALKNRINQKIRNALSPRHVPDEIYGILDVPQTLNGKKLEVPVKKILMGMPVEKAVNLDSMHNPESMNYFLEFADRMSN